MPDLSALIERLKNNKLTIPALAIGAVAGGYVLLKNGGLGASGSGTGSGGMSVDDAVKQAQSAASQSSGGNSGGEGGVSDALAQQTTFAQSITDQFNKLVEGVSAALGQQQSQTQSAIDAVAGQQQGIVDQVLGQLNGQNTGQGYAMPDFSSIYGAIAAIPQQISAQQQAPMLNSSGAMSPTNYAQSINKSISSFLPKVATVKNYTPPTVRQIVASVPAALPKYKAPAIRSFSGVRGSIVPTYNSPKITSRGGFGSSSSSIPAAKNVSKIVKSKLK